MSVIRTPGIRTISWIMVPITYLSNPYGHKNKSFYSKAREGILGPYEMEHTLKVSAPNYFTCVFLLRNRSTIPSSSEYCVVSNVLSNTTGNMLNGLIQYILILYYIWVSKEQPFVPSSVIIYSQLSHVHNVTRHT